MPLSYTRFTGRALITWLLALPLALWPLMGWATPPAMLALCYVVLGIDEIGVEIEEPFCILPLQALCDAIRRDVGIAKAAGEAGRVAFPGGFGCDDPQEDGAIPTAGGAGLAGR
jgi:predicted membrane chloride channel (bestrophin family)